jgi:hypothetical protein
MGAFCSNVNFRNEAAPSTTVSLLREMADMSAVAHSGTCTVAL